MVWIFSGLAWLAMILNIAGDFFKSMTGKVDAKVKPKQDEDKHKDDTEKQVSCLQKVLKQNMRGSRNFRQGGQPLLPENSSDNVFLVINFFFTVLQWFINGLFQIKL